jgi:hypothetical protein
MTTHDKSLSALVVSVTLQCIIVATLAFDALLGACGHRMLTWYVWDDPWLAWPVVLAMLAGAAAMGLHFHWRPDRGPTPPPRR